MRKALLVSAAILIAFSAPAAAAASRSSVLPWIEDDYGKALAEARARHLPIFAEAWAPW
jgi:hypothetical protein